MKDIFGSFDICRNGMKKVGYAGPRASWYLVSSTTPTISKSPLWLGSPMPKCLPIGSCLGKNLRTKAWLTTATGRDDGVSSMPIVRPRQHQGAEVRQPEVSIHLRRIGRRVMKRLGEHQRPEALDRKIQRQVRAYPDDEQPDLEMTEQAPEGIAGAGRKFGGRRQASLGGERLDFSLHNLHAQFRT